MCIKAKTCTHDIISSFLCTYTCTQWKILIQTLGTEESSEVSWVVMYTKKVLGTAKHILCGVPTLTCSILSGHTTHIVYTLHITFASNRWAFYVWPLAYEHHDNNQISRQQPLKEKIALSGGTWTHDLYVYTCLCPCSPAEYVYIHMYIYTCTCKLTWYM